MEQASCVSGRIQHLWLVRAGLSDPNLPARTVSSHLLEFPEEETQVISHTHVGAVRDAFAHIIQRFNSKEVEAAVAQTIMQDRPIVLCHIDDEASMRLRSMAVDSSDGRLARG